MSLPENNRKSEDVLKKLDEMNSKYRFMEINLTAKKRKYVSQNNELICYFQYFYNFVFYNTCTGISYQSNVANSDCRLMAFKFGKKLFFL